MSPAPFLALWWWSGNYSKEIPETDQVWVLEDYSEDRRFELFQQYLRIDSSYPDGSEVPAAEFLAAQLEAAGFEPTVERIGHRNANVWAIIEGQEREALILLNHLDVEPVTDPSKWKHPPFSGTFDPPFVYGRGAFDMKSYTIAQLEAFIAVSKLSQRPRRSLIFLATGDEERGGTLGAKWWLREHPEIAERVVAVLNEGGAVEAVNLDEVKYWGTEVHQKRFVTIRVCSSNRNRLEDLRDFLGSVEVTHYYLDAVTRSFFSRYSPSRQNPSIGDVLASVDQNLTADEVAGLPDYHRAMLSNAISAWPVLETSDGSWYVDVVVSLLAGAELSDLWDGRLLEYLEGYTFSIDWPTATIPASPLDHWLFEGIEAALANRYPGVEHGPLILPWSVTDSRYFRELGIPSYGFTPFWILSSDAAKMRGANERLPVPAFVAGVELYEELVVQLMVADK